MKKLISLFILSLVAGYVSAETSFNDFVQATGFTDLQAGLAIFLVIIFILMIIAAIVWGVYIGRSFRTDKVAKTVINDIQNINKQTNLKDSES